MNEARSLVEYLYEQGGPRPFKCGYCKSPDTSFTQGVWGFKMTCQDFQNLVDRGFQRSGKFVYKPALRQTCCPQYVIRMDTRSFKLSKSQRSCIKKFKKYLLQGRQAQEVHGSSNDALDGEGPNQNTAETSTPESALPTTSGTAQQETTESEKRKSRRLVRPGVGPDPNKPPSKKAKLIRKERKEQKRLAQMQLVQTMSEKPTDGQALPKSTEDGIPGQDQAGCVLPQDKVGSVSTQDQVGCASPQDGVSYHNHVSGEDQWSGGQDQVGCTSGQNHVDCTSSQNHMDCTLGQDQDKSKNNSSCAAGEMNPTFCQYLKDILALPKDEECVHKFETRLVRLDSDDFKTTFEESYEVFHKFQTIIHKEKECDADRKQFNEFLVQSPLRYEDGLGSMATGYGTYHQQYLLDGKIFAVGVLDILQKGVVCEYLYYDPEYRFIAPGVITALLEVSLTQQFYLQNPDMQYYYMGFYVQSCPKMNYKRRYSASSLLCPETHTYVLLEKCIPKLKSSPYSKLADDDVENWREYWSEEDINNIPVFMDMTTMPYSTYKSLYSDRAKNLIEEYVKLVGLQVALSMRLYLARTLYTY